MEPDIDVERVIKDLGGPAKVAGLCNMRTGQAVSMWVARNRIPPARLMFLRVVRPDVFTSPAETEQQAA
jgi:hypothetical protein